MASVLPGVAARPDKVFVPRVPPVIVAGALIVAMAVAAAVLRIFHRGHVDAFFTNGWLAVEVTVALVYAPAGALVLRRGGSRVVGMLFLLVATGNSVSAFVTEYGSHGLFYAVGSVPEPALVSSLQSWIWVPGNVLLGALLPLLLPDGRLRPGRHWRWFAGLALVAVILRLPAQATNPWPWPLGPSANPLGVTSGAARQVLDAALAAGIAVAVVPAVAGITSVTLNLRESDGQLRAQLRWLLAGCVAVALNVIIEPVGHVIVADLSAFSQLLQVIALPLLPLTAAVAVLRHRLWGIEALVQRGVLWVVASACVVGLYASCVLLAGLVLGEAGWAAAALAACVVALASHPIRLRLQARVDQLLFGDRGDPLVVSRRLGSILREAAGPDAALQQVVETLGRSLHLRWAAIDLAGSPSPVRVAQWGEGGPPDGIFPLVLRGGLVGELVIGCRPGDSLTPRLRTAIDHLCPHAAAVAAASRFDHELVNVNRRVLAARDDERTRLRRDLHDGLGPALAGMALGLTAARNHMTAGEHLRAGQLLDELGFELERKVREIRAIVYGLRPPQLDDLGLVGALEQHLQRYDPSPMSVSMRLAGEGAGLPAGVEWAAYHIAVGAIDNALRHSRGTRVEVDLVMRPEELSVRVVDDGFGFAGYEGVGIRSMRERAASVQGSLHVGAAEGCGTVVEARFGLLE